MAIDYTDLRGAIFNPGPEYDAVRQKVEAAIAIRAEEIAEDANAAADLKAWAAGVSNFRALRNELDRVWPLVVAANQGQTLSAIQNATDNAVQNNVNAVINNLASGDALLRNLNTGTA